jgi:diadenosine tetraphosphatase ApaH/serine/threonine PP2A family protein phosphatase
VNNFFDTLPLAAVISDSKGSNKVFCCHGGIGSNSLKIDEIMAIKRPLKVSFEQQTSEQQRVVDLLWNDPADDEDARGMLPNTTRDPNNPSSAVKKFGPDILDKFLKMNNISMIIRSHQHSMKGEDRFA